MLKRPTLPIGDSQHTEDTAPTAASKSGDKPGNQKLVSGLFSQSEFSTPELAADLTRIAVAWSSLPEHIRAAIKALIQAREAGQK